MRLLLFSTARGCEVGTTVAFCGSLATKTSTESARMESCGNIVSGGRLVPLLHFGKELVVSFRPIVECGMPEKSGCGAVRPRCAADLSSRNCFSAKRDDGFRVRKSIGSAGARFSILSESCHNQTTRRSCLIEAMAEEEAGNHITEEKTPEAGIANLGPPDTVRKSVWTSPDFCLQVGIFFVTLGFVDAGFSEDWSRIGVLSKEIEGDLRMAALGVVPFALTLIWSISQRRKQL